MNSNIQDYIDLVRSGKLEVCKDQLLLCDMVERVFSTEDIYVDEEQLNKYLNQQKYFPFQLYEWERFCFALHNCTYKANGLLRFPDLLILVGRGAGKNGYLSFEDFCLLTPINGIKQYHIDICANSEDQARTISIIFWRIERRILKNTFAGTKKKSRTLKPGRCFVSVLPTLKLKMVDVPERSTLTNTTNMNPIKPLRFFKQA